jgi:hypothetical protein
MRLVDAVRVISKESQWVCVSLYRCKVVPAATKIVGGVIFYAIRVVPTASWRLVLPKLLVSILLRTI